MRRYAQRFGIMLTVVLVALAVLSLATAHSASAQFGCFGTTESDFANQLPGNAPGTWSLGSGNWTVTADYAGTNYVWWHRNDQTPNYYANNQPSPIQGYHAYGESYPAYCGYPYDTSLITPPFSTAGMREVLAEFDYQFYVYSSEKLAVDYRIGNGSWVHVTDLSNTGSTVVRHTTVDISGARGQSSVQVRFRYYNTTSTYCDWWTNLDNIEMTCAIDAAAVEELPVAMPNPDAACINGVAEFQISVTNTGTAPLQNRPGQPEFTVSFQGTAGGALSVRQIASGSVGAGQIPGASPLGGHATADLQIPVGGTDIVTVRVGFAGGLGSVGDVYVYRAVWVDMIPPIGQINQGELYEFEDEDPFVIECDYIVDPNRQLGMQVHLPILNYLGNDDLCETWIEVQAVGAEPMKAVLITWGEPGFCPPQAAGPLKVECTGLLMPGSTWNLLADQIPSGSKGGMLFKFSAKQLSDVGLDDTFGFDDILADLMCETLFFGVVGDADDYRRFKKAYNEGSSFGGIPQDIAAGWKEGGILAVDVLRDCPSPQAAGVRVTSKYNGIAGSHLGAYDPIYGGYGYYVPLVYADRAGFTSWIYIQNAGLECSSVEIWFKDMEECLRAQICEVSTLAPGETLQVDPNDCVNQFMGSAWVRTSQPMAIAVDITGRDVLMTYVGEPAELNYTFDPEEALVTEGNQVAFGPLIYSEYQGWDAGIQVQNMSPIVAAKVKVYFLDRSGDVITTLVDWVCPRGSQTFFLPVVHDLPGNWVGSVRVESQEWITPGGPLVAPPNIVGVVTLIKYSDAQRTETREAIAYNLLPEHKIYDWQIGLGAGGLNTGIGMIAIPSLLRDLDGTGVTSELAIANIVPKPGFTDFAIYIYDQNGLMDYVCQKLNEKQVEYIDLQSWGYVNAGFKGSAIISAVFWEHDVFDGTGQFLRNLVGLGAVAIERSKTRLGEDIAGDEAAGDRGIPFKQSDIEDAEFEFGFLGPYPPLCPGVPTNLRQPPGEGPAWLCPPTEVAAVFGTCASDPGIKDCGQATLSSRFYRDGSPTECGAPDACSTPYTGSYQADWYLFDNPDGKEVCVEVTLTSTCPSYQPYMTAYLGQVDPTAPCAEYVGGSGSSGTGTRMGFTLPSGTAEWSLLFSEVYPPAGACNYSFTIAGFDCQ